MLKAISFPALLATFIAMLMPAMVFLYVKFEIIRSTKVYECAWSNSGSCYIDAYIPGYKKLGILGTTVALFSGNGFYRVYNKNEKELRSYKWILWQRDFPDLEGASWVNGHVFYSTADGYAGWTLPECG